MMIHLQPTKYLKLSQALYSASELPWRYRNRNRNRGINISPNLQVGLCQSNPSKIPSCKLDLSGKTGEVGGGDCKYEKSKGEFGILVSEEKTGWRVRRMAEEDTEMRNVAQIQALAFHEPLFFFDNLFFQFFQAEVLSGLLYRLRNSAPDRYACLVAESAVESFQQNQQLVGVVDVTVHRDRDILEHLVGAEEYIYVSGIAVLDNFRRKKVATTLLKACEMLATLWGYEYLVLRAYEDDLGARKLYTAAGYKVVSRDPPWATSWIGRRRRVLMIKRSNNATIETVHVKDDVRY